MGGGWAAAAGAVLSCFVLSSRVFWRVSRGGGGCIGRTGRHRNTVVAGATMKVRPMRCFLVAESVFGRTAVCTWLASCFSRGVQFFCLVVIVRISYAHQIGAFLA